MPGDANISATEFDFLLGRSPQTDFSPLFGGGRREPIDLAEYSAGINVARTIVDAAAPCSSASASLGGRR